MYLLGYLYRYSCLKTKMNVLKAFYNHMYNSVFPDKIEKLMFSRLRFIFLIFFLQKYLLHCFLLITERTKEQPHNVAKHIFMILSYPDCACRKRLSEVRLGQCADKTHLTKLTKYHLFLIAS